MTAPAQPMLARRQLRLAVVGALQAVQAANQIQTIDSPGDWNTPPEKLPAILVRGGRGRKDSVVRGMAEFNTVILLELEARIAATTAAAAQDAIEALAYVIENTVYNDYNVVGMVQQFASVDEEFEVTADGGKHYGGVKMAISCEMFEAFDPTAAAPAASQWPAPEVVPVTLTSMGIHLDATNVYDPSGTYTPSTDAPPYTPTPAPRTTGPDGRDEGALSIPLT